MTSCSVRIVVFVAHQSYSSPARLSIDLIVINRTRGRTLHEVAPKQFEFLPAKGKENTIFVLRRLVGREVERQKDLYPCFIYCMNYLIR